MSPKFTSLLDVSDVMNVSDVMTIELTFENFHGQRWWQANRTPQKSVFL